MARERIDKVPEAAAARDRYFGAILEDLNGKFSLLLEGYGALDSRMARIEERMDKLERHMDNLEAKFEAFRVETNEKFAILFVGQQEFFDEMRQFHLRLATLEGKS
jgi:predicted nuclease with TOPRIM domain